MGLKTKKGKQELLAMGELAFFLLAWTVGIVIALNGGNANTGSSEDLASSGNNYSTMNDMLE